MPPLMATLWRGPRGGVKPTTLPLPAVTQSRVYMIMEAFRGDGERNMNKESTGEVTETVKT